MTQEAQITKSGTGDHGNAQACADALRSAYVPIRLRNDKGIFEVGNVVRFRVENQISGGYQLDTHGTLQRIDDEWVIETRQGVMTINKGYDAYLNTIEIYHE